MMLQMQSPIIKGRERDELYWGTTDGLTRKVGAVALHVNHEDGCDLLVLRYKFSLWHRLKILFGQSLFVWLPTMGDRPQWPQLHLTSPQELETGQVLPYSPEKFYDENLRLLKSGEVIPTETLLGNPSTAMAPDMESEMRKTVREKLSES